MQVIGVRNYQRSIEILEQAFVKLTLEAVSNKKNVPDPKQCQALVKVL